MVPRGAVSSGIQIETDVRRSRCSAGFIGAAVEHNKARGERTAAKKPASKGQPVTPADQPA